MSAPFGTEAAVSERQLRRRRSTRRRRQGAEYSSREDQLAAGQSDSEGGESEVKTDLATGLPGVVRHGIRRCFDSFSCFDFVRSSASTPRDLTVTRYWLIYMHQPARHTHTLTTIHSTLIQVNSCAVARDRIARTRSISRSRRRRERPPAAARELSRSLEASAPHA
jgi:hypothetical protein